MAQNAFKFFDASFNRYNFTLPFVISDPSKYCSRNLPIGWYYFGKGLKLGKWVNEANTGCPNQFATSCQFSSQFIIQGKYRFDFQL